MKYPQIVPNQDWRKPALRARQIALLEKLSNACGVSGDEGAIRQIVLEEIRPFADDIKTDALGNVLVTKNGTGRNRPRVMVAAHMDEVGFMLTSDEGKGIFRFAVAGGIDARQLAGKQVWVGKNNIPGIIGQKPVHLSSASERSRAVTVDSLRIDVGPVNGGGLKIGDRATFATNFTRIGPSLRGKALDDRIGVATLILLLQNAPQNIDLLAAFTVQEEVGLRGAAVAAYTFDPDMGIALDCTPAMDLPVWDGSENTLYRAKTDLGPAIYIGDGATLSDPRLVGLLRAAGDAYGIPYQLRQPGGGGTDAGAIHKQRAGIPSVSLSVPGRYLHTAASIVRLKDWQNQLALMQAALSHIDSKTLKDPR
jgi:endoglucanase